MDARAFPGGGSGGGGGGGPGGSRAFAVGYRAHTGDMMVFGGGVLTLIGVLAAVVRGEPGFLVASLVGSLSAFYFHPTLDLTTPQLGADRNGLYVARFGIIPWDAVETITVERHALRTMRLATLVVETKGPVAEAVSRRDEVPLVQRFAARNARLKRGAIRVPLHTLRLPIDVIEARVMALYAASRL